MKSIKLAALALCIGFSALSAGEPKARNSYWQYLNSPLLIGGGGALRRQATLADKQYHNYFFDWKHYVPQNIKDTRHAMLDSEMRQPIKPSLYPRRVGNTLIGAGIVTGLHGIYRFYYNNILGNYYPTK